MGSATFDVRGGPRKIPRSPSKLGTSEHRTPLPLLTRGIGLTLKTHLDGLLNYILHPITNAMAEGFNSKIQAIKADARGFRRFENYRYRILFHCGKLDLAPAIS